MRSILSTITLIIVLCVSAWSADTPSKTCKLVHPGSDGKLVYEPYTDKGDRMPDFSNCGYKGGGVDLPKTEVKETVQPVDGDDGAAIQAAIDKVSKLPVGRDGLRGAVLLKKGKYEIAGSVVIAASGVVLRGEGQGEDGAVLVATAKQKSNLIRVAGQGKPVEVTGSRTAIADDYVPVGARSLKVENAAGFKVGQKIMVLRPSTAEWIHELGMDRIRQNSEKSVVQWTAGSKDFHFDRVITAIKGNQITVDAPMVHAIQKEYGGGFVYRYNYPGRISNVGVENLRGVSEYDASKKKGSAFIDEAHGWNLVTIEAAENAWIRDVTSVSFGYSCVTIQGNAKWVTVLDCSCLDPVSEITGGRRYSFGVSGQLNLIKGCFSHKSRHDFVLHANVPGPNAFVDCKATDSYCTSEPHHRYSAGALYDNVSVYGSNGYMQAVDRGNSGSGHGWSGAQIVFWNCSSPVIIVQQPPLAQNFIIGFGGTFKDSGLVRGAVQWASGQSGKKIEITSACVGDGYIESPDALVEPRSLYEIQLKERLAGK